MKKSAAPAGTANPGNTFDAPFGGGAWVQNPDGSYSKEEGTEPYEPFSGVPASGLPLKGGAETPVQTTPEPASKED